MGIKWKRLVAGMLSVCLAVTFVPQTGEIGKYIQSSEVMQVFAKSQKLYGKCGKNATWKYDTKTRTLTIGGTGATEDYDYYASDLIYRQGSERKDPPWKNLWKIKKIVIGDGITKIGEYSFAGLYVEKVKLGKNIKKIGNSAFHGCSELKVIKSGDGVKEIGNSAFYGCVELKVIKLGDGVKKIGASAFEECSSLKKISLGKKIEKIGKNAFWGCKSLEKINFGDHLKKIGARAFLNCKKITNLYIGKSLKNMGKEAFYGCYKLKKMKIHPKNKYFVMEGNVLLNKKKTKIYFGMFSSNTTCQIGANVKNMDFSIIDNEKIERFEVNSSNKKFYSEDGLLYSKDGKKLYLCPRGKKGTVVISEKAEELNEEVSIFEVPQFEDCERIEKIIIGKNVKDMDFVFGTDKIEIDAENPYYTAEQGCILSKDKKRLFHVFAVEKDGTFTVPKGVTKVEYSAFFNDDIKHIILSDEVEDLSFMRMYGVQSLTFGEKYYNGGDVSWLITSFDEHEEIMDLSALNVSEKNPYYSSVDGILYNKEKTKILLCPPAAKKCVMPDTVNSVDKYAFSCNSLREISISDSLKDLTEITERLENSLLKKIHIGKSVEKLSRIYTEEMKTITVSSENQKYKAVKNILYTKDGSKLIWCPEGKTGTVTIPEGTSIIGKGAFENDDKIKKIIIPKTVRKIGKNAFYGINKKTIIYVPKGKKAFYKKMLTSKTGFVKTMTIKEKK